MGLRSADQAGRRSGADAGDNGIAFFNASRGEVDVANGFTCPGELVSDDMPDTSGADDQDVLFHEKGNPFNGRQDRLLT